MNTNLEFTTGKILPALIKFTIPLMLSLILQALYGAVDLMVVGQFDTNAQMAAVANGSQIMQAVTMIITGLSMGVTVCIGQAIGAKDNNRISKIIANQIVILGIAALIIMSVLLIFPEQIINLINVPDDAIEYTVEYIRICGIGMIFITAYNGISAIYRGLGNSKTPFIFVLIACIINVFLDLLFVAVFKLGAKGASLATIISQASSVIFSLIYMKKSKLNFKITKSDFFNFNSSKQILKVGLPIATQDFLLQVSFLVITALVNKLGLVASSSIGVSEKLFFFLAIVSMSFLSSLSAYVAQNIGAGKEDRALKATKIAILISFSFNTIVFLLTFFAGDLLTSIFTSDKEVIVETAKYLKSSSFEYLLISFSMCLLGYFNGIGKTTFVMIQGLLTSFFIRIPVSYILINLENTNLFIIGFAVTISASVSLILCLTYFIILRRKSKNNLRNQII